MIGELIKAFSGKKVLITGGSGFIGSRLIHILSSNTKIEIDALIHSYSNAIRIARYPIKMIKCDISNKDDISLLAKDYDFVFHLAYGNSGDKKAQQKVTVEGTKNLLSHFKETAIEKFVHISTMMVYGTLNEGTTNETLPYKYSNDSYADSKIDAEKLVLEYGKKFSLPVVILQPSAVYGPWAPSYTVYPLDQLKSGKVILPDDGKGLLNIVYIDDVIHAILLAANSQKASGEKFLISSGTPVTYKEFYKKYEQMLGTKSLLFFSLDEIKKLLKQKNKEHSNLFIVKSFLKQKSTLNFISSLPAARPIIDVLKYYIPKEKREKIKGAIPSNNSNSEKANVQDNINFNSIEEYKFMATKAQISIEHANNILGFSPSYDLERGMLKTEEWAKWAKII